MVGHLGNDTHLLTLLSSVRRTLKVCGCFGRGVTVRVNTIFSHERIFTQFTNTYFVAHSVHGKSVRVYVGGKAIALPPENFWSRVYRSSPHRHCCLRVEDAGGAIFCYLCLVPFHRTDDYVLGPNVTMDDRDGMKVENSRRSLLVIKRWVCGQWVVSGCLVLNDSK